MPRSLMECIEPGDASAWWSALDGLPDAHPFYHPDVLAFLGSHEQARPELVVYREGRARIAVPWLVRELPASISDIVGGEYRHDVVGPDYGGPIGDIEPDGLGRFYDALRRYAVDRGILTAFFRLNPFSTLQMALGESLSVHPDRDVVWLDLSRGFEALWSDFEHSARKNYKRFVTSGIDITTSSTDEDVEALTEVYSITMARREAAQRYRFDLGYFRGLLQSARDRTLTVTARKNGQPAASQLYLLDRGYAFSYLGGALSEFVADRPTNGVVTEAIKRLAERGANKFILGGGYRAGDGIERFKRTFSPSTVRFRTQRFVFDAEAYNGICSRLARSSQPLESAYFPAYRAMDS